MIDLFMRGFVPCFWAYLPVFDGMPDSETVTLLVAVYFCIFYNFELCSGMHLSYLETEIIAGVVLMICSVVQSCSQWKVKDEFPILWQDLPESSTLCLMNWEGPPLFFSLSIGDRLHAQCYMSTRPCSL